MESDAHLHELKRDSATSSELHSNQKALAVSWILTVLCSFMVILRFHVRLRITKKTFSDDWIILFALVSDVIPHASYGVYPWDVSRFGDT